MQHPLLTMMCAQHSLALIKRTFNNCVFVINPCQQIYVPTTPKINKYPFITHARTYTMTIIHSLSSYHSLTYTHARTHTLSLSLFLSFSVSLHFYLSLFSLSSLSHKHTLYQFHYQVHFHSLSSFIHTYLLM